MDGTMCEFGPAGAASSRQEVVPDQAHPQGQRAMRAVLIDGHDEGEWPHQMRRQPQQDPPLAHGFPHQAHLAASQVPQAAVNEAR